jgi:mRNA-degrading endonuclease toxin of MazEF toxin-antitoxin module
VKGVVMVHQLKSFDWRARRARIAGRVSESILASALDIVKDILEGD